MKIGVADTTFSRVDMFRYVKRALADLHYTGRLERVTVPGIKDLPAACVRLLKDCDVVIALGMPGNKPIDEQCAHEASLGIIQAQVAAGKPIVEVFVHMSEAKTGRELAEICADRAYKHAANAYNMIANPKKLSDYAGQGLRQGSPNAGPAI